VVMGALLLPLAYPALLPWLLPFSSATQKP
jgi:hypothetical protein